MCVFISHTYRNCSLSHFLKADLTVRRFAGSQNSSPKGQDLVKKDRFEVNYRRAGSFPLVTVDIQHYFRTQMVDFWLEHGFSFAVALKEELYGKIF